MVNRAYTPLKAEKTGQAGASSSSDGELSRVFATQVEQCLARLARQSNFALLKVNYNELVREPRFYAEQLDKFPPGLDVSAMVAAVDPALYRQRL